MLEDQDRRNEMERKGRASTVTIVVVAIVALIVGILIARNWEEDPLDEMQDAAEDAVEEVEDTAEDAADELD